MILERIPAIQNLSTSEKLILVGELWDDLAINDQEIPVDDDTVAILRQRAEEYRLHPEKVIPWEEVRLRYLPPKAS